MLPAIEQISIGGLDTVRGYRESQIVRDNALAVSGLLNTQVGGPSVKPYQPPGIWDGVDAKYEQDQDENPHGERDGAPDPQRLWIHARPTWWTAARGTPGAFVDFFVEE